MRPMIRRINLHIVLLLAIGLAVFLIKCTIVYPIKYVGHADAAAYAEMADITGGLIKATVFGLILSWVGAYKGYRTTGGARGVGRSTTQSVVTASIMILVTNYFLTKLLENL